MDWDKPFLTFEQQVRCLQEKHHLLVHNPEQAARILQDIPYYDLVNGYKEYTMDGDVFHSDFSFELLHAFYLFDRDFQSILFNQSVLVENSFKNKMAYVLAEHFGVHQDAYLADDNFLPKKNRLHYSGRGGVYEDISDVFSDPKPQTRRNPETGEEETFIPEKRYPLPTRHYKDSHNHIPPWILLRNVSFSTTINLFSLMRPREKRAVVSFFFPEPTEDCPYKKQAAYILAGMNLIRKFRNTIAHDLKFVTFRPSGYDRLNISMTRRLFPSFLTKKPEHAGKDFGSLDVYAFILALLYFLRDGYLRRRFCAALLGFFPIHSDGSSNVQVNELLSEHYTALTGLPPDMGERMKTLFLKDFGSP